MYMYYTHEFKYAIVTYSISQLYVRDPIVGALTPVYNMCMYNMHIISMNHINVPMRKHKHLHIIHQYTMI